MSEVGSRRSEGGEKTTVGEGVPLPCKRVVIFYRRKLLKLYGGRGDPAPTIENVSGVFFFRVFFAVSPIRGGG